MKDTPRAKLNLSPRPAERSKCEFFHPLPERLLYYIFLNPLGYHRDKAQAHVNIANCAPHTACRETATASFPSPRHILPRRLSLPANVGLASAPARKTSKLGGSIDHGPRRAPGATILHQSGATILPTTLGVPKVVSIL